MQSSHLKIPALARLETVLPARPKRPEAGMSPTIALGFSLA
jgi:hypothetical protein